MLFTNAAGSKEQKVCHSLMQQEAKSEKCAIARHPLTMQQGVALVPLAAPSTQQTRVAPRRACLSRLSAGHPPQATSPPVVLCVMLIVDGGQD